MMQFGGLILMLVGFVAAGLLALAAAVRAGVTGLLLPVRWAALALDGALGGLAIPLVVLLVLLALVAGPVLLGLLTAARALRVRR